MTTELLRLTEALAGRYEFEHEVGRADRFATAVQFADALVHSKGNVTRALDYYGRFVELWKDADPVLQPRVAHVRLRARAA